MNIIVGCEESQAVCLELRKAGHNAFSCDLLTCPALPQVVRDEIKNELNCDQYMVQAITEKVAMLDPEKRNFIENLVDEMLAGTAEISIEPSKTTAG